MTEPDGLELDMRLAKALGWKRYAGADIPEEHREWRPNGHEHEQIVWISPDNNERACNWCGTGPPAYHESLYLLVRDVEPMAKKGCWSYRLDWVNVGPPSVAYAAMIFSTNGPIWRGSGPTPATALARAFLAALEGEE